MRPARTSEGTTGVALVRVTSTPSAASSSAPEACRNIEGTITARRPRVSISRPPATRTAMAAAA